MSWRRTQYGYLGPKRLSFIGKLEVKIPRKYTFTKILKCFFYLKVYILMHMGIKSVVIVRGSTVLKNKRIAPMGFMVYF
jgi:hypothetical protein